jgi:hypothetical protein
MLLSQASALELMFTGLSRKATGYKSLSGYQTVMKLALKAQNQSRATLHTLMQRHQSRQTAFIKQANIAHGPQQVNNPGNQEFLEKKISTPNKLLAQEEAHGSQKMDTRTKTTTKQSDSRLETVETGHRTQNFKRKSQVC